MQAYLFLSTFLVGMVLSVTAGPVLKNKGAITLSSFQSVSLFIVSALDLIVVFLAVIQGAIK